MIDHNFCNLEQITCLEDFLKDYLDISKSQLKKYLPSKSLKQGFKAKSHIKLPLNLLNKNRINCEYIGETPQIICDDDDYLVLSKPCKIHSHPHSFQEKDNILSYINSKYPSSYLNVNKFEYDRGLLYRLDYETSGLIIYCKNEEKYNNLRLNFSNMIKTKTYFAKIEGHPNIYGKHTHYLKATGVKGSIISATDKMSDSFNNEATILVEEYSFDETSNTSIIKVILHQGHRHQIRVQLSQIGTPIVGDSLYGGKPSDRLYLHCYSYKIDGKPYTANLPF